MGIKLESLATSWLKSYFLYCLSGNAFGPESITLSVPSNLILSMRPYDGEGISNEVWTSTAKLKDTSNVQSYLINLYHLKVLKFRLTLNT